MEVLAQFLVRALHGLQTATFSLRPHTAERKSSVSLSSYKDMNSIMGAPPMTHLTLITTHRPPTPNTLTLGLGFEHMDFVGTQTSICCL